MRVNTGLRLGQRNRRRERHGDVAVEIKPLLFWTPDELENLLHAWSETIQNPPEKKRKTAGSFNARVYARFVELSGGSTPRTFQATNVKKQFLNHAYKFIVEFNESFDPNVSATHTDETRKKGRKKPTKKPTKKDAKKDAKMSATKSPLRRAASREATANHWFTLSQEEKKAESFKVYMTEQRRFALLSMDEVSFEGMRRLAKLQGNLSMQVPWTDDEVRLMYRAWRKAIDTPAEGNRNPLFSLNARMYEYMIEFGNGAMKRTKQSVILKKDAMKLSYEFIKNFNETQKDGNENNGGVAKYKKPKKTNWFTLTVPEQEKIVKTKYRKSSFMYFDEALFREMDVLMKATALLQEVVGTRQGVMWTQHETRVLIQVWGEILDRQRRKNGRQHPSLFGAPIRERFLSLHRGTSQRSERSILQKLESLRHMVAFISGFNEKAKDTSTQDWFALARPEKKKIHSDAIKDISEVKERNTKSYCDFDKKMFADTKAILKKVGELDSSFEPSSAEAEGAQAMDRGRSDSDGEMDGEEKESTEVSTLTSTSFTDLLMHHALQQQYQEPEDFALSLAMLHHGHIPSDIPLSTLRSRSNHESNPIILDISQEEHTAARPKPARPVRTTTTTTSKRKGALEPSPPPPRITRRERESVTSRSRQSGYESSSSDSSSESSSSDSSPRKRKSRTRRPDREGSPPKKKSRTKSRPDETPTQQKTNPELSAIAALLAKQSEHMFLVMREIRDEIKVDREEREKHREEMRMYREERRKHEEDRVGKSTMRTPERVSRGTTSRASRSKEKGYDVTL